MRGATLLVYRSGHAPCCFNPHAPCGARLDGAGRASFRRCFNPRAPCGARLPEKLMWKTFLLFQSTRPMRGATKAHSRNDSRWSFQSTRPMRGATGQSVSGSLDRGGFNPRAPCGARRCAEKSEVAVKQFQSTRPMRGATVVMILTPPM